MSTAKSHVLAYPFPSSGHTIPFLDLAKALVSRGVQVTLLVTPDNQHIVPTHIQTLLLPKIQTQRAVVAIVTFMRHHHYPVIVDWAQAQSTPPSAIISDFFLGWTLLLARDLHVPRLNFFSSGAFSSSVFHSLWRDLPENDNPEDPNSVISFPNLPNSPVYPWCHMSELFLESERGGPAWESHIENSLFNNNSWGVIFNTFTELERVYLDHMKKELGHNRVWAVGPVLPLPKGSISTEPEERGVSSTVSPHDIIEWLDSRADGSVIFVCFGSRAFLTRKQMEVLTRALELGGVNFILSVRVPVEVHVAKEQGEVLRGFSDRVRGRGILIEGWAPQLVILNHRAVGAFLTHCGWNSVLEGLVSGVAMLTWPMSADQYMNASLLVDQLGVAVRAAEGEKVPEAGELARKIEGVMGRTKERVRAEELRNAALSAIASGGSSQRELDALVKLLDEVKHDFNGSDLAIWKAEGKQL
ncbi:UDP-glycosyltransferase 89B1, partial [Mucuna pruriens]